jgi:Sortase domain
VRTSAHRRRYAAAVGAALAVAGVTALAIGLHAQEEPPRPPAAVPASVAADTPAAVPGSAGGGARPGRSTTGPTLPAAEPVRLEIPSIGLSTAVHPLGLNPGHIVQVPPLSADSWAGWYRYSPTPGQLGPSIVLGHVDSARYGPGVFYRLGALRPHQTVTVTRSDGSVAVFTVDRVAEYPKDRFPVLQVYGNTDHAALRLITCGGRFDVSAHSYQDNIVAFASLTGVRRAK